MGPELFGAGGGGGSGRSIGDMVIKHVSAPASELVNLTPADGRVLPVAGNEELADRFAPQYAMPATNFERVFDGTTIASAFFDGFWDIYGNTDGFFRVRRSASGAVGTWTVVHHTSGSVADADFAIHDGKIYLFIRTSTTNASLFESANGLAWSSSGKASNAALVGLGGATAVTATRMKAVDGGLLVFGSATRGGVAGLDYLAFSTDGGVSFTSSATAIATAINNVVQSGDKVVALHNNGGIQTANALQAAGGWTQRVSGVSEALYGATTTEDDVLRVVGALGRTLISVDKVNFQKGPIIDGMTTPVRMLRVNGVDVVIASSSALDSNRRINVSNDFTNWRSEKPAGLSNSPVLNTVSTDGSRILVGGQNSVDMTAALSFEPATEFPLPKFNAGPDHIAYIVTG